MKSKKQLEHWLHGSSIHNKEKDECCPDFSCCRPELLADQETRQTFYDAFKKGDNKTQNMFLGSFLNIAIATHMPDKKVYIAGLGENNA